MAPFFFHHGMVHFDEEACMFYYLFLALALWHVVDLSARFRTAWPKDDENETILMAVSAAVGLSLPIVGIASLSAPFTLAVLLAGGAAYVFRHRLPKKILDAVRAVRQRYRTLSPIPCLVIAIVGLWCWAWYF